MVPRIRGMAKPSEDWTPVSSSGPSRWQPVSVETGLVSIAGGYSRKYFNAPSVRFAVPGETEHVFVHLDKNAHWFLKGVGGGKYQKGDLGPVQVLQLLKQAWNDQLKGNNYPGESRSRGGRFFRSLIKRQPRAGETCGSNGCY